MAKKYWIIKIKIYFKNHHLNVTTFAKANGMVQSTLQRLVTEKTKNATVPIAVQIQNGTGGEIRASEILGLY